jgi:protein-disulfide isomerase
MTNARQARTAREKAAKMRAEAERRQARQRATAIGATVAALIVIVVGVGVLVITTRQEQKVVTAPTNLTDGGLLLGNPEAPITVDVYEDFICPACKEFQGLYAEQFTAWTSDGSVKIVYRPVAILDDHSTTNYSTRALNAFAAVLDTSPDAAQAYYDLLMESQPDQRGPGLGDDVLLDLAEQAGADRAAVEPAIASLKFRDWTKEQNEYLSKNFQENGKVGTPTVVVDGEKLPGWSFLNQVITQKLSPGDAPATTTTTPTTEPASAASDQ